MGIMVAFDSFETTKDYFDEVVSRYSNFVNLQTGGSAGQTTAGGMISNQSPMIDTTTKSSNSSPSSNSPGSHQVSPNLTTSTGGANVNDSSINIPSTSGQLQEVLQAAVENNVAINNLKNVPPVGILRAQQYESIASNMHIFNSPDARKCSISFDRELSRDNSQNQTTYDDEAINILNIFVRDYEIKSDDESLVRRF